MERVLIINEPTSSCCGATKGNCKCGTGIGTGTGVRNVTPLPRTDWDAIYKQDAGVSEAEPAKEPVLNSVVRSVGKATHTPLGIPAWSFD